MKLAQQVGHLSLALPQRGMPLILSQFDGVGEGVDLEQVLNRSPRINGMDHAVPSSVILPLGGMGFFGWPTIQGHRSGTNFLLQPQHWAVEERPDVVVARAEDAEADIGFKLIFEKLASVRRSRVEIINRGATPYTLDRCMAGSLLIPSGAEWVESHGDGWGREFRVTRDMLGKGLWAQENRRGRTSHDRFPAVIVKARNTIVYAAHLGWSGNHQFVIDPLDDGQALLHAGELFEPGEMILQPGEAYQSPWFYVCRDLAGEVEGLSSALQQCVRRFVLRWPDGGMRPRPVLLNSWEGNYFNHSVERLQQQVTAAADLGIERFVLDDGWFGKRDDDSSSLGDWVVYTRKYPEGLNALITHTKACGLEFGLWVEPEMVNPDSDLFRAHPDWVLRVKGQPLLLSRQQLVLDLTRREVFDYLFERLNALLQQHAISYLKWDMNRDLTHVGDALGHAATSRQTLAVYALADCLRAGHPQVEIETCASGGGRADYGMLERTHRVWVSDCTDALQRISIQAGASRFLPPEIMGCHISAVPNHQTGRSLSLSFRAMAAFFGHLGVELDPTALSAEDRAELKQWIALHKSRRALLHNCDAVFSHRDLGDGRCLFGTALRTGDGEHHILAIAQLSQPMREQPEPVRFNIASSDKRVRIKRLDQGGNCFPRSTHAQLHMLEGAEIPAQFLAEHGLNIPQLYPETAVLLELTTLGDADG